MNFFKYLLLLLIVCFSKVVNAQSLTINFNTAWQFQLATDSLGNYTNNNWRTLQLPHDWSIEGNFSSTHNTTFNEGALPAGIGWYKKQFTLHQNLKGKKVLIYFDGVFCNSEVWINNHYLGKRPYGYVPFEYDVTNYLPKNNEIKVKVDNSLQPNSRYYTGSGIYRNVWLKIKDEVHFTTWGVYVTTPIVTPTNATIKFDAKLQNAKGKNVQLIYTIVDATNKIIATKKISNVNTNEVNNIVVQIPTPKLWSPSKPYLYKAVVKVLVNGKTADIHESKLGVRTCKFDALTGFYLNNIPTKILGVCMHHDLGALGAAVNKSAIQRQLSILKNMGCNAIRTAHNPPSTEFLDACDEMGFLVMDEAFDIWQKKKNKFDYNKFFKEWHKADIEAMVLRDRNHASVFMWSIGNEIREQFDSTGTSITKNLVAIVKNLDTTRPVTCALTENVPSKNFITQANALDVLGFNYKHEAYNLLPQKFANIPILATETASALATRGTYFLPADSNYVWPPDGKTTKTGNDNFTCNAYDNTYAYWGTTHEKSWLAVKHQPYMAGLFVWSGFDFLGEPVPYQYPARSSYYGIVDMAGIPKDVYYMYKSEWSKDTVLHLLPHWNWNKGDTVDVWAYYNNADEVELFLNEKSVGKKSKTPNQLHVNWKLPFEAGILKAVSLLNGKKIAEKIIQTAGKPSKIKLLSNKKIIHQSQNELLFITVQVLDKDNNIVPNADNLIEFFIEGDAALVATDNGNPTNLTSFTSFKCKAFNGLCIAIVKGKEKKGKAKIIAKSSNLQNAVLPIIIN